MFSKGTAQQSVQRIFGSLRDLQTFFWLRVFSAHKQSPRLSQRQYPVKSTQGETQTVSRLSKQQNVRRSRDMLQNKQTVISYGRIFSIIIILSFGVFLTGCNNSQNSLQLPTVTKPANTATSIATQTEIPIPTPIPAKNGWTSEYIATISNTSVNQFTQEEIDNDYFHSRLMNSAKELETSQYSQRGDSIGVWAR